MQSRAELNEKSRAWWDQRRARGICAVCRLPLAVDKPWPVHPECSRLLSRQYTYAEVRAMSPAERRANAQRPINGGAAHV